MIKLSSPLWYIADFQKAFPYIKPRICVSVTATHRRNSVIQNFTEDHCIIYLSPPNAIFKALSNKGDLRMQPWPL